jgi:hypothetical protein
VRRSRSPQAALPGVVVAALVGGALLVPAAGAATPRTLLLIRNVRSCPTCALTEVVKPRTLAYQDGKRLIKLSRVKWEDWGADNVRATAVATVTIGSDNFPGAATIRAFRQVRHAPLCRARASDRIYTRVSVRPGTAAPAAGRRVTFSLPATGCVSGT